MVELRTYIETYKKRVDAYTGERSYPARQIEIGQSNLDGHIFIGDYLIKLEDITEALSHHGYSIVVHDTPKAKKAREALTKESEDIGLEY